MRLFNTGAGKLLATLITISLGLTPIIWFFKRGNVLLNGVDINFPLDPVIWFQRRLFVWNGVSNAGADFSSSTAGLFFHLIQVIPYSLGFNLTQVQMISLIFWFLLIVLSAYWFSRIILPKNPILQILFVVLYAFNIFMFNSWENIKVANLSLVAAIPFALSVLLLLHDKKISCKKAIFFSSLCGIIVSGSGINPSYFTSFFIIIFIYFFADFLVHLKTDSIKSSAGNLALVTVPIILINLFWILPTMNFIFSSLSPVGSIDKLGFTNWVDSLSENTSLVNVFRLQGAWDWYAIDEITGQPIYIPYAINYFYKLSFIVFSFLLPSLAFLSFLFVNKQNRSLYASFGLMLLVGVFLGAGTHLPTGTFYRWLMEHIPFFTLFRSPWYIFSPLVTLSYAGLICLFLYNFKIKKVPDFLNNSFIFLIGTVLISGNLIYSYPEVTGKIFRPASPDGFYISFPDYVFDAKKWLDKNQGGRIIGYPDDEIEKFTWGYRGIESLINLLSANETLFSPLNAPDSNIAQIIKEFYSQLKKGQIESASSIARKMSVNILFEKKDQESLSPEIPPFIKNLDTTSFGQWNFYAFPQRVLPKIYLSKNVMFGENAKKLEAKILGTLEDSEIYVNPKDSVIYEIPEIGSLSSRIILSKNSQFEEFNNFTSAPSTLVNRLTSRDLSSVIFSIKVTKSGIYQPILERYRLEDFGLSPAKNLNIKLNGTELSWEVVQANDSYVYFKPMEMRTGEHKVEVKLTNNNLVSGGDFESEAFEKNGLGDFNLIEEGTGKYLSIFNKSKQDISGIFSVLSFDPLVSYLVQFRYKQIYGNNGLVLVGQNTPKTLVKVSVERLPNYPEWNNFSFYYEPVRTSSVMKVSVVAPFTEDPLGTKVLYDDVEVFKVFTNHLLLKEISQKSAPLNLNFQKKSPVEYEGMASDVEGSHILVFSENYSPFWEVQLYSTDGSKIDVTPPHFSANLYANAWYIDETPKSYKFRIYYQPQNLFINGFSIGVLTIIVSVLLLLKDLRGKKYV